MTPQPLSSEQNCQCLPLPSDMRSPYANPGSQKSLSDDIGAGDTVEACIQNTEGWM